MTAILETWNPATRRYTEIVRDSDTGLPLITYTQDTRPIVERAKREAAAFQGTNRDGITKVATIPVVIWQRLLQMGIAHDEAALNAWLNERDNRVFRTDDGRKL
jgi:hypothetical protein